MVDWPEKQEPHPHHVNPIPAAPTHPATSDALRLYLEGVSAVTRLIARFQGRPRDFTWDELVRLLEGLGYGEHASAPAITLHKPHPGNIVKMYVIEDVLRLLTEEGLI